MALVLEDGTGLSTATSLVSVAEVRDFAASRGGDLPAVDADLEILILLAHDYLVVYEHRLQGYRRRETQALPYPRVGVSLYGRYLTSGTIPRTLKQALAQLVLEGIDNPILPIGIGNAIIKEIVGPITTQYALGASASPQPTFPRVDAFLIPLFNSGYLATLRV